MYGSILWVRVCKHVYLCVYVCAVSGLLVGYQLCKEGQPLATHFGMSCR